MKAIKRMISLLCCVSIFLSSSVSAIALEKEQKSLTTEYDLYVNMKKVNSRNNTYSNKNSVFFVEEELLRIKNLSVEEIKNEYGYNDKQIEILKNYEGTPIEDTPELRAVLSATLSTTLTRVIATSTSIEGRYEWTWSSRPLNVFTDIVGVAVYASNTANTGGASINIDYTKADCVIDYYSVGNIFVEEIPYSVDSKTEINGAKVSFPMSRVYGGGTTTYAKEGKVEFKFKPAVNGVAFGDAKVSAAYGHTVIATSAPSLSITIGMPSISFNFSWQTTEEGKKTVDMW